MMVMKLIMIVKLILSSPLITSTTTILCQVLISDTWHWSVFSSAGWANSITGQKLCVCVCVCVCLHVNHGGKNHNGYNSDVHRFVILCAQTYWWTLITNQKQDAQLSQRDCAAGCVIFLSKVEDWNWETVFYGHYRSIFKYCDIIGLKIYRFWWRKCKIRAITALKAIQGHWRESPYATYY